MEMQILENKREAKWIIDTIKFVSFVLKNEFKFIELPLVIHNISPNMDTIVSIWTNEKDCVFTWHMHKNK